MCSMCTLNTVYFAFFPSQSVWFFFFFTIIKDLDGDMSIFAQIGDSRHQYLIMELLCCFCSSCRSRSNLSYFAGDRSQSVLQTETMRSLTQVFHYFIDQFCEALSSKVHSLFHGTFLHYLTVQSIHWSLWIWHIHTFLILTSYPFLALKEIKVKLPQFAFTISYNFYKSPFFVHAPKKKSERACRTQNVYRAALQRRKKYPSNCCKEKHWSVPSRLCKGGRTRKSRTQEA